MSKGNPKNYNGKTEVKINFVSNEGLKLLKNLKEIKIYLHKEKNI